MANNVLITGANRGIGLALCKHYVAQGKQVFAVCRKSSEQLNTLNVTVIEGVDVSLPEGIARLKEQLGHQNIDILINNAGILRSTSLANLDYAEIIAQFNVNAVAPIRVVEALLSNLSAGSKIALITSRMGSIEDNTSGGSYGYRMSKCALNAAGKSLAVDLKAKEIAVALLHPGYVSTEMVNYGGEVSPEDASSRLIERIDQLNLNNSGTFWHANGEVLPW